MRILIYKALVQFRHTKEIKKDAITQPSTRDGLGIRRVRPINVVTLGRHDWELFHNLDKLWV